VQVLKALHEWHQPSYSPEQREKHLLILVKAVTTRRRIAVWQPDHAAGLRIWASWELQKTSFMQDVLVAACWLGMCAAVEDLLKSSDLWGPLELTIFGSALEAAARNNHVSMGKVLLQHSQPTEKTLRPAVNQLGWRETLNS
jgi:hypothetical protein